MRRPLRHLAALLFAVLLLSASSTQPVVEAGYPSGVYAVKGQYIWDSWIVADEGILHRYALSTPTEGYGPNDRQQHADESFTRWRLEPPMQLPQYYRQVEVPYMLHRGGNYDLFVSTQANPRMEENAGKEAAYRGYVSTNIDGPWKLIYTNSDWVYGHKIYAPTLFETARGSGDYAAVTFFSEDTGCPITGAPIVDIDWDAEGLPRFEFDQDLGPCLIQNSASQ